MTEVAEKEKGDGGDDEAVNGDDDDESESGDHSDAELITETENASAEDAEVSAGNENEFEASIISDKVGEEVDCKGDEINTENDK